MEPQETLNSKINLEDQKTGSIMLCNFEFYYRTTIRENGIAVKIERSREQNRDPRNISTYMVNYDKGGKTLQWGKDSLFNK